MSFVSRLVSQGNGLTEDFAQDESLAEGVSLAEVADDGGDQGIALFPIGCPQFKMVQFHLASGFLHVTADSVVIDRIVRRVGFLDNVRLVELLVQQWRRRNFFDLKSWFRLRLRLGGLLGLFPEVAESFAKIDLPRLLPFLIGLRMSVGLERFR